MPLLRLLRLPALFTTFPDVLAGYAIIRQGSIEPTELLFLLLASGLLYLSGMVLNDLFDYQQDLQERPHRPLPAGEISVRTASLLGMGLMLGGIGAAFLAGSLAGVVALLLAGMILAYNSGGKKTVFGPLLMGLCRSLNLLLGAACVANLDLGSVQLPLLMAGLIGLYITGVTLFARSEAAESHKWPLIAGSLLQLLALIGWSMAAVTFTDPAALRIVIVMNLLITFQLTRRILPAIRTGLPLAVQQAVRAMLLTIPMLEALVIIAHGGPQAVPLAIAAVLLMLPGQILSRYISMT